MNLNYYAVCLLASAALWVSCQGQKSTGSNPTAPASSDFSVVSSEQKSSKKEFPQHVDLEQDIESLNYRELRLLRSYVYAIHGHWFREPDLQHYFRYNCSWYTTACYGRVPNFYGDNEEEATAEQERYYDALCNDYYNSYKLTKLSAEEKAFVERIDQRMAALKAGGICLPKSETSYEGLLNPDFSFNMHLASLIQGDKSSLRQRNFSISDCGLDQLFQVYDGNEYMGMPNFITTDVMLQAFHMYYCHVQKQLEISSFVYSMEMGLEWMMRRSYERYMANPNEADQFGMAFCAVGQILHTRVVGYDNPSPEQIMADSLERAMGPKWNLVKQEVENVKAANDGFSPLLNMDIPYSLFKPRGYYTRSERLSQYFRLMMWMQSVPFFANGRAGYMAQLLADSPIAIKHLEEVDRLLTCMIGKPNNLSIMELVDLVKRQQWSLTEPLTAAQVDTVLSWSREQLASREMISPKVKIAPQEKFNLFPQRFVLDNDVLNTLYDETTDAERAFPTGLDVMSVFGVERASELVREYNKQHAWDKYYQQHDSLAQKYAQYTGWQESFYNSWMKVLLSSQRRKQQPMPAFMTTSDWQLKELNTSLASWALLKHDAILYAHQPMCCEMGGDDDDLPEAFTPRGYVEPNVDCWRDLLNLAKRVNRLVTEEVNVDDGLGTSLEEMLSFCLDCAEKELRGEVLSEEAYQTIARIGGELERFTVHCLSDDEDVYYSMSDVTGPDRKVAQVADVFTRNLLGCGKNGILHEAVGDALSIYVLFEVDGEVSIAEGGIYSYYEFVSRSERLTDEAWQSKLENGEAPSLKNWFLPLMTPRK